MVKFKPSASTNFAAFDGYKRTCTRFALKKVKVKRRGKPQGIITALRCVEYRHSSGKPPCHPFKRNGGRSKGLINKANCGSSRPTRKSKR